MRRPDGFDAPSRSLLLEEPEALRPTMELPPLPTADRDAEPEPAPSSARALRRRLRQAVRERRRAESAEVRRFTASTRRRRRVLAGSATAVVALIGVPLALAVSPVFAVRTVAVEGGSTAVSAAVRARLGGLVGTPLALVDQAVVRRAVSAVPQVATYAVASLPPGTLQVRIAERQPVGQVHRSGRWALIDAAGVVLATAPSRMPGRTVLAVPVSDPAFPVAVAVLRALPASIAGRVTTVSAAGPDDVRLGLPGGLQVVWGGAANGAAKGAALAAALQHVARGASVVDVSAPGLVTVR